MTPHPSASGGHLSTCTADTTDLNAAAAATVSAGGGVRTLSRANSGLTPNNRSGGSCHRGQTPTAYENGHVRHLDLADSHGGVMASGQSAQFKGANG